MGERNGQRRFNNASTAKRACQGSDMMCLGVECKMNENIFLVIDHQFKPLLRFRPLNWISVILVRAGQQLRAENFPGVTLSHHYHNFSLDRILHMYFLILFHSNCIFGHAHHLIRTKTLGFSQTQDSGPRSVFLNACRRCLICVFRVSHFFCLRFTFLLLFV